MPNTSEVNVHTCFLEKVRIKGFVMTKASILDHGIGLTLVKKRSQQVGWNGFVPVEENGSHLLTIQFLCTVREEANGVRF